MAVVGLERTFYNVSEDEKHVELCADVLLPNIECPIEFPFDIYLVLSNDSTGVLIILRVYKSLTHLLCREFH